MRWFWFTGAAVAVLNTAMVVPPLFSAQSPMSLSQQIWIVVMCLYGAVQFLFLGIKSK